MSRSYMILAGSKADPQDLNTDMSVKNHSPLRGKKKKKRRKTPQSSCWGRAISNFVQENDETEVESVRNQLDLDTGTAKKNKAKKRHAGYILEARSSTVLQPKLSCLSASNRNSLDDFMSPFKISKITDKTVEKGSGRVEPMHMGTVYGTANTADTPSPRKRKKKRTQHVQHGVEVEASVSTKKKKNKKGNETDFEKDTALEASDTDKDMDVPGSPLTFEKTACSRDSATKKKKKKRVEAELEASDTDKDMDVPGSTPLTSKNTAGSRDSLKKKKKTDRKGKEIAVETDNGRVSPIHVGIGNAVDTPGKRKKKRTQHAEGEATDKDIDAPGPPLTSEKNAWTRDSPKKKKKKTRTELETSNTDKDMDVHGPPLASEKTAGGRDRLKKKKKTDRKGKEIAVETDNGRVSPIHVGIGNAVDTPGKRKKKRTQHAEGEATDKDIDAPGPPLTSEKNAWTRDSPKKKKKKTRTELETSDTDKDMDVHGPPLASEKTAGGRDRLKKKKKTDRKGKAWSRDSPKKKKKKKKTKKTELEASDTDKDMDVLGPPLTSEKNACSRDSPKKKKKKTRTELEASDTDKDMDVHGSPLASEKTAGEEDGPKKKMEKKGNAMAFETDNRRVTPMHVRIVPATDTPGKRKKKRTQQAELDASDTDKDMEDPGVPLISEKNVGSRDSPKKKNFFLDKTGNELPVEKDDGRASQKKKKKKAGEMSDTQLPYLDDSSSNLEKGRESLSNTVSSSPEISDVSGKEENSPKRKRKVDWMSDTFYGTDNSSCNEFQTSSLRKKAKGSKTLNAQFSFAADGHVLGDEGRNPRKKKRKVYDTSDSEQSCDKSKGRRKKAIRKKPKSVAVIETASSSSEDNFVSGGSLAVIETASSSSEDNFVSGGEEARKKAYRVCKTPVQEEVHNDLSSSTAPLSENQSTRRESVKEKKSGALSNRKRAASARNTEEALQSSEEGYRGYNKDCYICKEAISSKEDYIHHLSSQHGKASYQCPKCNFPLLTSDLVTHHLKTSCPTKDGIDLKPIFPCSLCPMLFSYQKGWKRHQDSTHNALKNPADLTCTHCGKVLSRAFTLKKHVEKCSEGLLRSPSGREGRECGECGKTYASNSSLHYHIKTIHRKHVYHCACVKTFRSSHLYYAHIKKCAQMGVTAEV